jgi:AbrB family looped-hinge helix DNA binding protein
MKNINFAQEAWGKFHGVTSIGERGQLVIPKELRKSFDFKKGDKFIVMEKAGAIILMPPGLLEGFVTDLNTQIKKAK